MGFTKPDFDVIRTNFWPSRGLSSEDNAHHQLHLPGTVPVARVISSVSAMQNTTATEEHP